MSYCNNPVKDAKFAVIKPKIAAIILITGAFEILMKILT